MTADTQTRTTAPLLSVDRLSVHFRIKGEGRRPTIRAVDDLSLTVAPGETLAVVGESGCGKSTLARAIVRLNTPTHGRIVFDEADWATARERDLRRYRRQVQMVFQDPYSSLDPHMTAGDLVAEPLRLHRLVPRSQRLSHARELLDLVGLDASLANRRPSQLSGGQRQRVGIARAIAVRPRLLVCDEPTSALDVSVQAQVLSLLTRLRNQLDMSYLLITHNLGVVRQMADTVAVMYLGSIVESGPAEQILRSPRHPYTKALVHVVPDVHTATERKQQRGVLSADLPNPTDPPAGCAFHTRCPLAVPRCREERPPLREIGRGHHSACWRSDEVEGWVPEPRTPTAVAPDTAMPPHDTERN